MAGDRDELTASTELIEQLLGDRALRASFRADPESVLREHGLAELADDVSASDGSDGPERAMLTLELRESRSSLAGVIVAAAAEGVDFTHVAEHAAPRLGREAGRAISHLVKRLGTHHHRPVAKPAAPVRPPARPAAPPQLQQVGDLPQMAHPAPVHHHVAPAAPAAPAPAHPAHEATTTPAHEAVVASASAGHVDLLQYPGDGASSQQIAAWMGANAQRAGLPPELPVMASLTESGLRNLDYGDRDSVGFFQMRTGIWDQGAYAGFPGDPQLQIKWFIEEALSVRRADPAIAASPSTWGEWVANVERPAFEYRGRYQLQLQPAQELLRATPMRSVAAASAAGGVGSAGIDVAAGAAGAAHRESLGHAVKAAASACVGARCRAGGASAAGGFDGPGLVRYAYGREGVELPASAAAQFEVGAVVPRADLRPGDAVFFGHSRGAIQDVGIYVGDGRVITASTQREAVSIDSLDASAMHFLGARRYSERLLTDAASYARTLPTVK